MRTTMLMAVLLLAACADKPPLEPVPAGAAGPASGPAPQAEPCKRSDYPPGAQGNADFANCVIHS